MRFAVVAVLAAELLAGPDSRQLFNGKDLSGWTMVGPGRFVVENGTLKTEGGMGLLYYAGQKFGNQTVRIVFRTATANANSGVYIRLPEPPPDPWYGVHNGYEVQINAGGDEWHSTGAIYSISKVTKRNQRPEWNTMDIKLAGSATEIFLNGEKVNEFRPKQAIPKRENWFEPVRGPRPDFGYIGLQNHDEESVVYFKEISVSPAQPHGAAPESLKANPIPRGDRSRILSYYHATRKQVLDTIAETSDAQWNFKPAPDRWSIAEVVEHLIRVEDALFEFATSGLRSSTLSPGASALTDEKVTAAVVDRTQRAEAPDAVRPGGQWRGRASAAGAFEVRRDRNIAWLSITQEDLRGYSVKLPMGVGDVYQALLIIPAHTERHLAQIMEIRMSSRYPK